MIQTTGSTKTQIAASPNDVWGLLTDIGRIGEFSPECYKAEWDEGTTPLQAGSTFRGYNRSGEAEWDTECFVISAKPDIEWSFTVGAMDGPVTIWRYLIAPTTEGCEVTESFDSPALASDYFQEMDPPRYTQLRENVSTTLDNLKATAERA